MCDSEFNVMCELQSKDTIGLLPGTYYIKVVDESESHEVGVYLIGEPIGLNSQYVIHNNGYTVYAYTPFTAGKYHFTTQGDLNNTLKCSLKVCKFVDGQLVSVYETLPLSQLNETVFLENEKYYIIVELSQASDQVCIFSMVKK